MKELYHIEVGFPEGVRLPKGKKELWWGPHAEGQRFRHRKVIEIPKELNFDEAKVIEIEVEDGNVVKSLVRVPYDEKDELVLAVVPGEGYVKTCWLNSKEDNHRTQDLSRYAQPTS